MRFTAVAAFMLLLGACAQPAQDAPSIPSTAEDEAAIRAMASVHSEAQTGEDIEALMALYLDNAVRMNPNRPAAVGKEAIREDLTTAMAASDVAVTVEVVDVRVSVDLATAWGTWSGHYVLADGTEPYDDEGKWSAASLRQADGSWRILWFSSSSDLPPRPTP